MTIDTYTHNTVYNLEDLDVFRNDRHNFYLFFLVLPIRYSTNVFGSAKVQAATVIERG